MIKALGTKLETMSNYVYIVFERNTQFRVWTWGQGEEKWTTKCRTLKYYKDKV